MVLALSALLAMPPQNLVLKNIFPKTGKCRFGEGKEIFEFGYDITNKREMPMRVMLCSIRGCLAGLTPLY